MPADFFQFLASCSGRIQPDKVESEFRAALADKGKPAQAANPIIPDNPKTDALKQEDSIADVRRTPGYTELMQSFHALEDKFPLRAAIIEMRMLVMLLEDLLSIAQTGLDAKDWRVILDELRYFDLLCQACEDCPFRTKPNKWEQ